MGLLSPPMTTHNLQVEDNQIDELLLKDPGVCVLASICSPYGQPTLDFVGV